MHSSFGSRVVGLTSLAFFAVDRADVDDAAPALFNHVGHHLLGHVEHGVQVGVHHGIPVVAGHFQEHAVLGDASVVDQHVNAAMLGFGFGEGLYCGIPIADVAHRCIKGVTQSFLLIEPFGEVAGWATTCDDLETFLMKALANGGTDTPHATCDVSYFLTHEVVSS